MEFEITIEGPGQAAEILFALLAGHGGGPDTVSSSELNPNGRQTITLKETDPELLNAKLVRIGSLVTTVEKQLGSRELFEIRVRNVGYSEPSLSSKNDSKPFKPISSLTVQPWSSSLSGGISPDTIVLDSRNAFGTGKHPSTILCLHVLEDIAHGKWNGNTFAHWNVLDFGCGSGLLAMAAVRLGAKDAVGIEIDDASAATAQWNVQLNGLSSRIHIRKGSWETAKEMFDLILANVVPSVLFRTGMKLPGHLREQGMAVVSGFGEGLLNEMTAFFSDAGLIILERFALKTWGALLMCRKRPQNLTRQNIP